ncbi:hypothetical protein [Tersicoccus sp. Bi-70]|uniref:hypothetical protein n=1 Tax=Tersicoccus sp. Bi-70 TaxID=1897634 RepID=UPI0009756421|nr:hypothetical protein [Tersicoccus sp. Bi-70]OMH37016.1 hypothetical protein BGP79_15045 [Tersicoccus sp. Bi-70]
MTAVLAAGLAVALSGCTAITEQPRVQDAVAVDAAAPATTSALSGSWATGYPRLTDLVEAADVVVIGTVLPGGRTTVIEGLPYLDVRVAVTRWVAGRAGVTGTLTVRQTGGVIGGREVSVEGDPVMHAGERAILFLDRAVDGRRAVLGGPTGRLVIDDDERVRTLPGTSLTEALPDRLSAVVAAVRAAPPSPTTTPARR